MARAAHVLAAAGIHGLAEVGFQRLAEGVVHGDVIPAVAALVDQAAHQRIRHGVGVPGPMESRGRAVLIGQRHGAAGGDDVDLLLLARHFLHRQRGRRVGEVDHHVDAVGIEPAARQRRSDIGLVLVIGGQHRDGLAQRLAAELLDGHLGGDDRALAGQVGIGAGHIGDDADLHAAGVGQGGSGLRQAEQGGRRGKGTEDARGGHGGSRLSARRDGSWRWLHSPDAGAIAALAPEIIQYADDI
ncbi:hypothetical protein D3C81_1001890 [compost metagenome]